MIDSLDIRVRGIVQGVGFRPFVYRLARRYLISGWVLNDLDGVFIHAEGESHLVDEFVTELHMNPPAAAKISEVELVEVPLQDCKGFEIRESAVEAVEETTLVSADLATCDDCLRELFDPHDRRYRYPFINCTNCGPRFTIIDELPYDRPKTSMAPFEMCDSCAREYADPADRRFHAQPDACFDCGPHLSWAQAPSLELRLAQGRAESDAILASAVELLASGGIVAVKGLGGFHLACDASNAQAVAALRSRKHRDGKAFAVMATGVEALRCACEVSAAEEALLCSPARPIVLLRKLPVADAPIARGVADGLPELGAMLPATPVQHLLLHDFHEATGGNFLVMTSGNVHDEPIVVDDGQACEKLAGIADAILGNDRAILARYDDSVVRVLRLGVGQGEGGQEPSGAAGGQPANASAAQAAQVADALQFIRRARGYAPVPIALAPIADGVQAAADGGASAEGAVRARFTVLAAGSEQKNTFTFASDGKAYVSQHVGDMEDADVFDAWLESKQRFQKLFGLEPQVLACDAHPEYIATKWADGQAFRQGLPLTRVQHHHAHIASVLGEHGLYGPAIGVAFDGTGYGADGAIWGGEVLLANQVDYERFANLAYMPMPGGAAAIKEPLRMAYGMLWAYDLLDHPGAVAALQALGEDQAQLCAQMIESGLNTPMTSSMGRLFDAVSAVLGICTRPTYEGEAAILLDAARTWPASSGSDVAGAAGAAGATDVAGDPSVPERYAFTLAKNSAVETSTAHDTSVVLLDAEAALRAVLDDHAAGVPIPVISQRFHDAVVGAVLQVCELVRAMYGISLVALSGGCFMNRYLAEQLVERLGAAGFTVALNGSLPPNDGCVSFGQAVVASASR